MEKFLFISTIGVVEQDFVAFRSWMEEKHINEMHETGCFVGPVQITPSKQSKNGFLSVTYTHELRGGEDGWNEYNALFRKPLVDDFLAVNAEALKNERIKVLQSYGWVEERYYKQDARDDFLK